MVTILDMVDGKFLPRNGERDTETRQRNEWPMDSAIPSPRIQPLPVSTPCDTGKMPPDLATVPVERLLKK